MKTTLVRHSAWVAFQDPQFKRAVELAHITDKQAAKVTRAGGIVMDPGTAAYDREYDENYPDGTVGITPNAKGTFARATIDGSQIYIPATS